MRRGGGRGAMGAAKELWPGKCSSLVCHKNKLAAEHFPWACRIVLVIYNLMALVFKKGDSTLNELSVLEQSEGAFIVNSSIDFGFMAFWGRLFQPSHLSCHCVTRFSSSLGEFLVRRI